MHWSHPLRAKVGSLLVASFVLIANADVHAGAWSQEAGHGVVITTARFYTTGESFDSGGKRRSYGNDGQFTKWELNVYAEYAPVQNLTLIGNFFGAHINYEDNFSNNSNIGFPYQELGVRYQFAQSIPQSIQIMTSIPSSSSSGNPPLSNGQFDLEIDYFIGGEYSLGQFPGWWDIGVGYRFRFGAPADEIRWYAMTGLTFTEAWGAIFKAEGIHGLGNDTTQINSNNVLLTTNFQLIKLTAVALYRFNENWVVTGGPIVHLWGQNTGAGAGAELSLWYEF